MNDMTPVRNHRSTGRDDGPLNISRRGFLGGAAALVLSVT
ncbi:MAG: twin-arginine translocation signal domain-containing protein, partial [Mesorhizobium sp.]